MVVLCLIPAGLHVWLLWCFNIVFEIRVCYMTINNVQRISTICIKVHGLRASEAAKSWTKRKQRNEQVGCSTFSLFHLMKKTKEMKKVKSLKTLLFRFFSFFCFSWFSLLSGSESYMSNSPKYVYTYVYIYTYI